MKCARVLSTVSCSLHEHWTIKVRCPSCHEGRQGSGRESPPCELLYGAGGQPVPRSSSVGTCELFLCSYCVECIIPCTADSSPVTSLRHSFVSTLLPLFQIIVLSHCGVYKDMVIIMFRISEAPRESAMFWVKYTCTLISRYLGIATTNLLAEL